MGMLGIVKKITLLVVTITVVLLGALLISNFIGQRQTLASVEEQRLETLNGVFWDQIDHDAVALEKLLAVLTTNVDLVDTFISADREQLIRKASPIFSNLKSQFGITHYYFIDKNGVVFLRAHSPTSFGDTLKRATFLQARDTGKLGKGIEMGKSFFSLRVVMPVRKNGEVVGYFELGEELDHFVKNFKSLTKAEISVLVSDDYAKKHSLTSVFTKTGDWYRVMTSDEALTDKLTTSSSGKISTTNSYGFGLSIDNKVLSARTYPFKDAFGDAAGIVMIANDTSKLTNEFHGYMTKVVFFAVLLLISFVALGVLLSRTIVRPLHQVNTTLRDIAEGQGDLTVQLSTTTNDEVGELANNFNKFVSKLHGIVIEVTSASQQIVAGSSELNGSTQLASQGVSQQRKESELVATAVNEMAATVQEVARSASEAAKAADKADGDTESGRELVLKTITAIKSLADNVAKSAQVISHLKTESQKIGGVLDVIKGIAEQTNLLALNAAIEAARAGEQGRGFAVVADEVRTLAQRTQKSTSEIEGMIGGLQLSANEAEVVMQESRTHAQETVSEAARAGESFTQITHSVSMIRDMNTQIATASEEQSSVAGEINRNINNLHNITEESERRVQDIANASEALSGMGRQLQQIMGQFKV